MLAVAIANTVEAMAVVVLAKAAMALCGAASSNSLCLLGRWQQSCGSNDCASQSTSTSCSNSRW